jgi:hypothetical protein
VALLVGLVQSVPPPADLRAIIDRGRGDVPLKDLKFRLRQVRQPDDR